MDTKTNRPCDSDETLRSSSKSGGLVCGNSQGEISSAIGQRANGASHARAQVHFKSTSVLDLVSKQSDDCKVNLDIFKQNFEGKQLYVFTENNKLGQWYQILISQLPGTERVVFDVNPLFGQVEESRNIFVRALSEQLFHLEPCVQFIISISLREEFLTRTNLQKIIESLKSE